MSTASEMAGRFYCSSLLPADNSLAQFPCLTIVSKENPTQRISLYALNDRRI